VKFFWDKNIEVLEKENPKLHQQVVGCIPEDVGEIISTQTVPTFRFRHPGEKYAYAYSSSDPVGKIKKWLPILKNENDLNTTICVFIGMGLGYSQLIALKQRKDIC